MSKKKKTPIDLSCIECEDKLCRIEVLAKDYYNGNLLPIWCEYGQRVRILQNIPNWFSTDHRAFGPYDRTKVKP